MGEKRLVVLPIPGGCGDWVRERFVETDLEGFEYKPIELSDADVEFLGWRKLTDDAIARMYGRHVEPFPGDISGAMMKRGGRHV